MATFTATTPISSVDFEGSASSTAPRRRDGHRPRALAQGTRHGGDVRRATRRGVPGAPLGLHRQGQRHDALPTEHPRPSAAGQAYYIRPGHNAHVDADVEIVEFTLPIRPRGSTTLRRDRTASLVFGARWSLNILNERSVVADHPNHFFDVSVESGRGGSPASPPPEGGAFQTQWSPRFDAGPYQCSVQ